MALRDKFRYISLAQLNTLDGAPGSRRPNLIAWLQMQARSGVNIVTFCEANGWQDLERADDISKNRLVIEQIAASGGYSFVHVTDFGKPSNTSSASENKAHPYNLGIISTSPFEVLSSIGPPQLQRGLMHTYFPRTKLHLVVLHLHAHSTSARLLEARLVIEYLRALLAKEERIILTGDFNSLNPLDKKRSSNSSTQFTNRQI